MLSLVNPTTSARGKDAAEGSHRRVIILGVASLLVLITGVVNLIALQWGSNQVIATCGDSEDSSCDPVNFSSPFTQQLAHSIGQALCLIIHVIDKYWSRFYLRKSPRLEFRSEVDGYLRESPSPFLWAIPAILDFAEAILTLFAGSMLNQAVVQVLRNLNVVLTAAFAGCLMGVSLKLYHWLGILLLTVGCTLIGIDVSSSGSKRIEMMGVFVTFLGTSLSAFLLVYEESVFRVYRASPFEAIGWIGFFELWFTLFAFGIAHGMGMEQIDVVWFQLTQSLQLRASLTLFTLSVAVFTTSAICTIKLGGCILTVSLFASRQLPLWLAELSLGWTKFSPLPLVGIIFVALAFVLHTSWAPWANCFPRLNTIANKVWVCRCRCILIDPELSDDEDDDEKKIAKAASSGIGFTHAIDSFGEPEREGATKLDFHAGTSASTSNCDTGDADVSPMFRRNRSHLSQQSVTPDLECWIYVEKEAEWMSSDRENDGPFLPSRQSA
eukprot:Gregarina_sp_Poly_1__8821@NODE_52_length_17545_cov_128_515219_g44_i0_p5_GENE_NODE_52_length_17545_cov_128_515219_g44_i0NODE_52_length_17545_cov_128_515219_g44_i0_p5_ORF_typecomplete_len496_score61_03CRTlike/PF08627_10/9_8e21Nuc_sug_transp/PF04142_15/2_3e20SLC35F/PF06027_12/3e17UAA/PF08449_11/1_2e12PUNUT/PF16913_5/1_1e06TPT/PF03151_16/5_8e03TPT/PF03151_16/5_6e05Mg_trans_NIPA/PF05653_14/3_3e03Mg_trans_NIPA/PF05653_14/0_0011Atthog/PF18800_1/6e02Atthog/PF18800_1/0_58Atthog/PF18800_1/7_7e03DUF2970/PF